VRTARTINNRQRSTMHIEIGDGRNRIKTQTKNTISVLARQSFSSFSPEYKITAKSGHNGCCAVTAMSIVFLPAVNVRPSLNSGIRVRITDFSDRRVSRSQWPQLVFCCYVHVRLMIEKRLYVCNLCIVKINQSINQSISCSFFSIVRQRRPAV